MNFKKAIAPLVVTGLILIIVVTGLIVTQKDFMSLLTIKQSESETQYSSLKQALEFDSVVNNELYIKNHNTNPIIVDLVKIDGKNCNIQLIIKNSGMNEIPIAPCLVNVSSGNHEIVLYTSNGLIKFNAYFKKVKPNSYCYLDRTVLLNGQSDFFYNTKSSLTCTESQSRTCTNGALSGSSSYRYSTCTIGNGTGGGTMPGANCELDGVELKDGESWTFYDSTLVPDCAMGMGGMAIRTCNNGVMSAPPAYCPNCVYSSCNVMAPAGGCGLDGVGTPTGVSQLFYPKKRVISPETCSTPKSRSCQQIFPLQDLNGDGIFDSQLDGDSSYKYISCTQVAPVGACTVDGTTVNNGDSISVYNAKQVSSPRTCDAPISRTCTNGVLDGNTDYYYTSCAQMPSGTTCTLDGITVPEGQGYQFYSIIKGGGYPGDMGPMCRDRSLFRVCQSNGQFSGDSSYKYGICDQVQWADSMSCFIGDGPMQQQLLAGMMQSFYQKGQVVAPDTCGSKVFRTCQLGLPTGSLDGDSSYKYSTCNAALASGTCSVGGSIGYLADGQYGTFYKSNSVLSPATCSDTKQRRCDYGIVDGDTSYQYTDCNVIIPSDCWFDSQTIPHGTTFTAYAKSVVENPEKCTDTIQLTCNNGNLDGYDWSHNYASCRETPAGSSCQVSSMKLFDGESYTFYNTSAYPNDGMTYMGCYGTSGLSQKRTCSMGVLDGNSKYQYSNCMDVHTDCTLNGGSTMGGGSYTFFDSPTPVCNSQLRTCKFNMSSMTPYFDGNPAYQYSRCSVPCPALDGVVLNDGDWRIFYTTSSVIQPDKCANYGWWRWCTAGVLNQPSAANYASCTELPPGATCTLDSKTVSQGQTIPFWNSRNTPCSSSPRTCQANSLYDGDPSYQYGGCACGNGVLVGQNTPYYSLSTVVRPDRCSNYVQYRTCLQNGSFSGTYPYSSCIETDLLPGQCQVGSTVWNDTQSRTFYQSPSVPYGSSCVSQVRTCVAGIPTGSYQYSSCSPLPKDNTPDSFTFNYDDSFGAELGQDVISKYAGLYSFDQPINVTIISPPTAKIQKHGDLGWSNSQVSVIPGDYVRLKVPASGSYNTVTTVTVLAGDLTKTWNVQTKPLIANVTGTCTNPSGFYAGSGKASDPYIICSCEQLQNIDNYLGWTYRNYYYYIAKDIDCSASKTWNGGLGFNPIGDSNLANYFTYSVLDGGMHKITNLYINRRNENGVALFSILYSSTVKNILFINSSISGAEHVATVFSSMASYNNDQNIISKVGIINGTNRAQGRSVALLGGSISECILSESFARGNVYVGTNTSYPQNNQDSGGFISSIYDSIIVNSYFQGSVIGSFCGGNGGFMGYTFSNPVNISKIYSVATTAPCVPGITAGGNPGGFVYNSYWNNQISSQATACGSGPDCTGVLGKTTAQMRQQATYSGWDFTNTWKIQEGVDYPKLKWEP